MCTTTNSVEEHCYIFLRSLSAYLTSRHLKIELDSMARTKQAPRTRSVKKRVLSDTESSDNERRDTGMFTNGHLMRSRQQLLNSIWGLERERDELERVVKGLRVTAMEEASIIKDIMTTAETNAAVILASAEGVAEAIKQSARNRADEAIRHMRMKMERAMARIQMWLE